MNNKMLCHSQLALSPQETAAQNEKSFQDFLRQPLEQKQEQNICTLKLLFSASATMNRSSRVTNKGTAAPVEAGLLPLGEPGLALQLTAGRVGGWAGGGLRSLLVAERVIISLS